MALVSHELRTSPTPIRATSSWCSRGLRRIEPGGHRIPERRRPECRAARTTRRRTSLHGPARIRGRELDPPRVRLGDCLPDRQTEARTLKGALARLPGAKELLKQLCLPAAEIPIPVSATSMATSPFSGNTRTWTPFGPSSRRREGDHIRSERPDSRDRRTRNAISASVSTAAATPTAP